MAKSGVMNKQQLYIPREPAEFMRLNDIHPDSEAGRAILSRFEQGLSIQSADIAEYPGAVATPTHFKRSEIILNPASVESARTWFVTGFYIGGALSFIAGGAYLVSLSAAALGANIVGAKIMIGVLLVIALIIIATKIKTRQTVVHEKQTVVKKTYNQYNDCTFN